MARRKPRCLLIEDDDAIARMYAIKLEQAGWAVEQAADAEAALRLAAAHPPQAVLLDIMLPGGPDGFDVLERLRADPRTRDTAVVILSNSDGTASCLERARELRALGWLTKSTTSPAELVARLDRLVGGR